MSPAAEIGLLVAREMRRSVRSAKGIVLGIVTLLGAILTSVFVSVAEKANRTAADGTLLSNEQFAELRRQAAEHTTGNAAYAAQAAQYPMSLSTFLNITIWLGPLLIALLGFDAVSSELQHRSVRFWTVRARRGSYFAGKLLGLWGVVALVTLALNVLCGAVALARGYITAGELFSWGVRFWLTAFLIAGAWAAIATFISSCFKTPVLALLTTFATFFVLWVVGASIPLVARARQLYETGSMDLSMRWYEYFYPNAYQTMLLAPEAKQVCLAVAILLGFVGLMTAAGSFLFQQRDV